MPTSKYPLKPVLEHRERAVDGAKAELGGAVRARESAEGALARAERERDAAEARAAAVKADEAERLARGELRVADLAQASAWEERARSEIATLESAVHTADQRSLDAREHEAAMRARLATKMSDRDVVAKDQARFEAARQKRVLSAEEEAAEEAFRGGWKAR